MKQFAFLILGILLVLMAITRLALGEPEQMWRACVSAFLGLGNICIAVFWDGKD